MRYDFLLDRDVPKGIGNRLFLLGVSEDGPYMEPLLIRTKEQARKVFGDANKGTLVKAFDEAYDRKEDISIYLMRITGNFATLEVEGFPTDPLDRQHLFLLRSVYAGEKYNKLSIKLNNDDKREIHSFTLKTLDHEFVYEIPYDMTVGAFVKGINEDCRMGRHKIMASTDYPQADIGFLAGMLSEDEEVRSFDDGDDGLHPTRNELYLACDLAYQILQGRQVDIVVPVGMYVDDVHPAYLYGKAIYGSSYYSSSSDYLQLIDTQNGNKVVSFHEQLIEFCREQMRLGYMSKGVIGIRPFTHVPKNIEEDNTAYISRLAQSSAFRDRHGFTDYKNGLWYDKGYFVSVVGHELIYHPGKPEEYTANGAVRYAAILAGNFDTTTNVEIGDDVELRYELSNYTLQELSRIGVVTFRNSIRRGNVVTSGVTAGSPESELHSVANVRMVQITLAYVNQAVEMIYEGEFDAGMRRNYLEELLRKFLDDLQKEGVILQYDYKIQFRNDDVKGEILLFLEGKHTIEGIQTSAEVTQQEV